MSFIGTAISAPMQAHSEKVARSQNLTEARATRAQNQAFFEQSRGSTGSAVLPTYLKDAEKRLSDQALAAYNAVNVLTPEQQLAQYQSDIAGFAPAQGQANQFVDSIYSDALLNQRQQEAEPVFAARSALAKTQKQGILDDITARLNALDTANAQKGYVGGGTGFQNAQFRSTVPLYQQAAGVGAQANLQNAQDLYGIGETNRQLKLQSLSLPTQVAQQAIALRQLPQQAVINNQLSAQKPFGMFNIGTAAFRQENLPPVQPIASLGAIAGTALGGLGNDVAQIYANNQRAAAIRNLANSYKATTPQYNPYAAGAVNYDAGSIGGGYVAPAASSIGAGGAGSDASDMQDIASIYGLYS